ncbi:MAG: type VII secretion protein EssC, partial [Caldilineaceae bacterium]|nr:type VII secretion protein EssC [Caldilineaceae bacterium]
MTTPTPRPVFSRSPRLVRRTQPVELTIPDPPPAPDTNGNAVWLTMLPLLLMILVMGGVGLASGMTTMLYFSVPLMGASAIGSVAINQYQKRKAKKAAAERTQKYGALLKEYEQQLTELHRTQYELRNRNDPTPDACLEVAQELDRRLWERTADDEDFLVVRVGLGDVPTNVQVKTPEVRNPIDPDPLVVAARNLVARYAMVEGVPLTVDIQEAGVVGIGGDREFGLTAAFTLLMQLATHHAPHEVKLGAIFPPEELEEWAWLRWLPHTWHEDHEMRFLANRAESARKLLLHFERLMDERIRQLEDPKLSKDAEMLPRYVLLLAWRGVAETDPTIQRLQTEGPRTGIYPVFIGHRTKQLPRTCRTMVRVEQGESLLIEQEGNTSARPLSLDRPTATMLDQFALAQAPIVLQSGEARQIRSMVTLFDLFGVARVEDLNVAQRWEASAKAGKSLITPIGMEYGDELLMLDLHEKADGPNGLVAGMVGAGKSELLQTLVASLVLNYHPHRLALVLVDYKGGGMAKPFERLPHTLGIITNLQNESLAQRALTSFDVELKRRQRLFDTAKGGEGVVHIDDYQKLYDAGQVSEPLPYLVVIVDEFAEMKTEQPDVAKEFVRIARTGRALGLRLILAMQKPAGIVDGQIEANTRFRLCLRVAQTDDSMAMLRRPEAAYLQQIGRAYLQIGANEQFKEFQVAWSGAAYAPDGSGEHHPMDVVAVHLDGRQELLYRPPTEDAENQGEISQLRALTDHLESVAAAMEIERLDYLWLPPLPEEVALPAVRKATQGWNGAGWTPGDRWLAPTVGLVDRPRERVQDALRVDLGSEGHLAIYAAPGYGKTVALQTLIMALAQDHTPSEVNLYVLDFGGRILKMFEPLPHVGAVIASDEGERLDRFFLFLRAEMERRRKLLGDSGAASLQEYRRLTGNPEPAIVVVVDNFKTLYSMIEENETQADTLARLAQDGMGLGMHFVLTATNGSGIRFNISSNIMLAIALQQVDASEYANLVGRTDGMLPEAQPGRGLVRHKPVLECQLALPADGETDAERNAALRATVEAMAAAWTGPRARPIGVLPAVVELASLLQGRHPTDAATIGLHVDDLSPLHMTLADGPHFLVTGPSQSGKSTLLTTWATALAAQHTPDELALYIIESPRQSLAKLRELPHVVGHAVSPTEADALLAEVEARVTDPHARETHADDGVNGAPLASGDTDGRKPHVCAVLIIDDVWDVYDDSLSEQGKQTLGA